MPRLKWSPVHLTTAPHYILPASPRSFPRPEKKWGWPGMQKIKTLPWKGPLTAFGGKTTIWSEEISKQYKNVPRTCFTGLQGVRHLWRERATRPQHPPTATHLPHTPGSPLAQWLSACGLCQQRQPQDHWGFLRNAISLMPAQIYRIRNGLGPGYQCSNKPLGDSDVP